MASSNLDMNIDFTGYLSPFTWRYGSPEMRRIWSEVNKRLLWRRLWVALAEVQAELGLVNQEQLADLRTHMGEVDVERALEIETEIRHDLMAELKNYVEQAPLGGGILHMGATSADIQDNADVLRIRQSLDLILEQLRRLLLAFVKEIEEWADTPLIAFTHLQPAEPSTLGYRLAQYAQDLLIDWRRLSVIRESLLGKGFKGAVGTGASYAELIGAENLPEFEELLSVHLDLGFFRVTTQVYPRKQDYEVLCGLAGLGATLHKFAFDLRILQSPPIGELSEPFGKGQVGSSAMPFKRNPISAEKIDSLSRELAQMPRLAWDNAANLLLERTLDDSANRRTLLPEAFLITDELLLVSTRIVGGMQVNESAMARNLSIYSPFAAMERVLMAVVKAGADRQEMHERLRKHSLAAWREIQSGGDNPLSYQIVGDTKIRRYLSEGELLALMEASNYLGDAPQRARELAGEIRSEYGG